MITVHKLLNLILILPSPLNTKEASQVRDLIHGKALSLWFSCCFSKQSRTSTAPHCSLPSYHVGHSLADDFWGSTAYQVILNINCSSPELTWYPQTVSVGRWQLYSPPTALTHKSQSWMEAVSSSVCFSWTGAWSGNPRDHPGDSWVLPVPSRLSQPQGSSVSSLGCKSLQLQCFRNACLMHQSDCSVFEHLQNLNNSLFAFLSPSEFGIQHSSSFCYFKTSFICTRKLMWVVHSSSPLTSMKAEYPYWVQACHFISSALDSMIG